MAETGLLRYTEKHLQQALEAVRNGMPIKRASNNFNVPRSTLQFRLKAGSQCKTSKGPMPVMHDEETILVEWILKCAEKGFPRHKQDVLSSVQQFLTKKPRPNLFKDNCPGEKWYKSFLKRHPIVSERTSEAVTSASACVTENDIRQWFTDIEVYFKKNNLFDIFSDPRRVFNGDETCFQLCPKTGKVLAAKGAKNVFSVEQGSSKDNLTVMFTFSASGQTTPPMIVYPYKRVPMAICMSVPKHWGIAHSDTGWMKAEIFYEYIANVFNPYVEAIGIPKPIIMFVDGHKTHLTYQLSQLCCELQIEMIALYPNSTRILQPADVAAFHPVKEGWRRAVRKWRVDHPMENLTKVHFAPLLEDIVNNNIKEETVQHGFKACGLCPWNPDAINYSKCLGSSLTNTNIGETNQTSISEIALPYDDFKDIVGAETMQKFEEIEEALKTEAGNEHFFVLYRLWTFYQDKLKANSNRIHDNIIYDSDNNSNHRTSPEKANTQDLTGDLHVSIEIDSNKEENLSAANDASLEEPNRNILPRRLITDKSAKTVTTPVYADSVNQGQVSANGLNKMSDSSLGDYLVWPQAPKRKGKRDVERLPFVITSDKFQKMCKDKELAKQLAEEKKKERKLQRDKKKLQIEQSKIKKEEERKNKKRIISIKTRGQRKTRHLDTSSPKAPSLLKTLQSSSQPTRSNTCRKCFRLIKGYNSVYCSMCNNGFHIRCVPKTHKDHLPEDSKEDEFVCHLCFVMDDSDSYGAN